MWQNFNFWCFYQCHTIFNNSIHFIQVKNNTSIALNKIILLVYKDFLKVNVRLNIDMKLINTNYCGMTDTKEDNYIYIINYI